MDEQEMQFADPDWQPVPRMSPLSPNPEKDGPLPVNAGHQAWQSDGSGPSAFDSSYKQGYQGPTQLPAFPPVDQQTSFRQRGMVFRPRTRRRVWPWVVAFFVMIWLVPALFFGTTPRFHGPFVDSRPMPMTMSQSFNYDMTNISTLKINDPNGSIHVHAGAPGTTGTFDAQSNDPVKEQLQFVPASDGSLTVQLNKSSDGSPVFLDITLPQNIALDLNTSDDIQVDGIRGQVNLQANTSITLNNDTITGQSTISTDQGSIQLTNGSISGTYTITDNNGPIALQQENMSGQGQVQANGEKGISMDGTLDPSGTYTFTTDSGQIYLTLPGNTAMQLNIDRGNGTYTNDFPPPTGSGPQAQVNLKTNSGDIQVHPSQ